MVNICEVARTDDSARGRGSFSCTSMWIAVVELDLELSPNEAYHRINVAFDIVAPWEIQFLERKERNWYMRGCMYWLWETNKLIWRKRLQFAINVQRPRFSWFGEIFFHRRIFCLRKSHHYRNKEIPMEFSSNEEIHSVVQKYYFCV